MKIKLVSVIVNDPVEAHKRYTEVFGFVSTMFMPEAMLAIVASPEDEGGVQLLLEPNDNPIAKEFQTKIYEAGLPVIIFEPEDIQAEYERLKGLGVPFKGALEANEYGTQAIFEDGCGN